MPVTDISGLAGVLSEGVHFETIGGKVAKSNDLAYSYGKYTEITAIGETVTGYYVHVWRLGGAGRWRLVADVQNPLPKAEN